MTDRMVCKVDAVGKKFCRSHRHNMYYGACDVLRGMMGLPSWSDTLRPQEFWALKGITLNLKPGERLGLLGSNGSGKSTLLRLLAGIYQPDAGRIEVKGRVCALIALGAGFHPLLTGRENIYLNGAILGMSKGEIDGLFDQIVEFSGVGEVLDAPVKTYSSGMYVRLGFAIAIHSDPDLLLVDEVLAVGDSAFQNKCYEKVLELNSKGTAIIFVSHSIQAVERLCFSGLLLKEGKQLYLGNIRDCIQRYYDDLGENHLNHRVMPQAIGLNEVQISDVEVFQEGGHHGNPNVETGKNIIVQFQYKFLKEPHSDCQVRVWIRTFEGRDVQRLIFQESLFSDGKNYDNVKICRLKEAGTIRIRLVRPKLFPQSFKVDVAFVPIAKSVHMGGLVNAALFNVIPPRSGRSYFEYGHMTLTDFDYVVDVH